MFKRFRRSQSDLKWAPLGARPILDGSSPPSGLQDGRPGLYLGTAFVVVILLMAGLIGAALVRMTEMHKELEVIVNQNNVKTELVNQMRAVVRDRMVAMHAMVLEEDPFKRDEVHLRYLALANTFIDARRRLENMAATAQEKDELEKLYHLTVWATPFNEIVVDSLLNDKLEAARMQLLSQALPAQFRVVAQIEYVLKFYKEQALKVEAKTHASYEKAFMLISSFAGIALVMSVAIAMGVVRRVNRDRTSLVHENAERQYVEGQLREARDNLEMKVEERTAELRHSRDMLAEAQKIGQMGYWEWDARSDEMRWSEEATSLLASGHGVPSTRQEFFKLVHPDDRKNVDKAFETAAHEGKEVRIDHRLLMADGMVNVVSERIKMAVGQDGGRAVLLGTIQDVTERKAAEEQLRLAAKVFENSGEAIMITNAENVILEVNWAFSEITGFTREEVIGDTSQFLMPESPNRELWFRMRQTLAKSGMWHGEIWGSCKSGVIKPRWLTVNAVTDETGKVVNYVSIFRDISAIKDKEKQLWHLAHHDALCGLPNRKLMLERLQESISRADTEEKYVALMLLDLDGFKKINDTFGHGVGDELLIHVANALRGSVREESDTVARLAGDEFVVIAGDIEGKDQAAVIAAKILKNLEQPLWHEGRAIAVNASIGVALYPGDSADPSGLLKAADSAMYQAKARGKKNYCFYDTWTEV